MSNARGWVGEGFRVARQNLNVVLLFWLAGSLPFLWIPFLPKQPKGMPFPAMLGMIVGVLVLFIVNFILWIGLVHYLKLKREGQETSVKTLWKGGLLYFWRYAGLESAFFGIFVLLCLVTLCPFLLLLISRTSTPIWIISILLSVILLSVGLYFFALVSFYAPIILVAESEAIFASIKKSYSFTRPRIGLLFRLFFLFFLVFVALFVCVGILLALFAALGMEEKTGKDIADFILSFPSLFVGIANAAAFIHLYLSETQKQETLENTGTT